MSEESEYKPPFRSEIEIIHQNFDSQLAELNRGQSIKIRAIGGIEDNNKAYRIIFGNDATDQESGDFEAALFEDWDDTAENYSERKKKLYEDYKTLVPQVDSESFTKCMQVINSAARVLPYTGIHPERYAPLLELIATSCLISDIYQGNRPEFFKDATEVSAREYLEDRVLPLLSGQVGKSNEDGKLYFRELVYQSTALDFDNKPSLVSDQIWDKYIKHMTSSNIPESEMDNFDLEDNVYWAVVTFGAIDFQMEKILKGLGSLKAHGKRMPNEIIILTQGRKDKPLQKLISDLPEMNIVYVDDSPRQLDAVEGVTVVQALRSGAKRAGQTTLGTVLTANMEEESLTQILQKANST